MNANNAARLLLGHFLPYNLLLLFLLLGPFCSADWAFLQDQSQCHLKCLNGGVCSFLVRQPEVHKCICLIGMFEGDQCEQAIGDDGGGASSPQPAQEEGTNEGGEEEEGAAAYEEEWTVKPEDGQEEGEELEVMERPPLSHQQTQRFMPETNTLDSTNLEHFAESRSRPVAAIRDEEERVEEPAVRRKGGGGKAGKKVTKKKQKQRPTTTEAPIEVEPEEAEGWMLRRRGGGGARSSAGGGRQRRTAQGITTAFGAGTALALAFGAIMMA